ncbi:MAG: FAD-dependent oxidoreductase [Microbacterium sp.]|uniref:FAD-dependent oxidoreductase n=1 Tax=Microbacterium sp. TaxID=51671 RepID=UPI003241C525
MSEQNEYDFIVVGAGITGLVAATVAAEGGARVALLEKTAAIGGSSVMSGGWFAFTETDEQRAMGETDSRQLFFDDLWTIGEGLNDRRLLDRYLDRQSATYGWLKHHGVTFSEVDISSGQSARRSHLSDITGLLASLHADFAATGQTTRFETEVERLITRDGRVIGVTAVRNGASEDLCARDGVLLATGGFTRSQQMLKTFAPAQLKAIPFGGRGNTGDGLRMAWKLGAGLADMSFVSGTYGSHPETATRHELLTAYYMGAVIVNQEGERFIDESLSYKTLGRAVLDQTDGLGYQIFDSSVRAMSHPGVPLKDMEMLEEVGHLHQADTLGELAEKIGVEADVLTATIGRYNRAVDGKVGDDVGRESLCNGIGAKRRIEAAPFYAYPAKSLLTTTYCGVTITPDGEVVDVDGDVIEGLYAAGEVTGGFHGAAYMTGTSLGKGAVFGHLIAENMLAGQNRTEENVNHG